MEFEQIDVTGCRLVGAITELGYAGPKHHGIIVGRSVEDNNVYIAENMHYGYQLATYDDFFDRYSKNGEIRIYQNEGKYSPVEAAQYALDEIMRGGKGAYNLILNNCESFVNRAIHNHSVSKQVVNTALGVAVLAGTFWAYKKYRG